MRTQIRMGRTGLFAPHTIVLEGHAFNAGHLLALIGPWEQGLQMYRILSDICRGSHNTT